MKRLLSLAVLALTAAAPLAAQERRGLEEVEEPGIRYGFWMSFGLGGGAEQLDIEGDGRGYSNTLWAPVLNFRIGGTVSDHLRIGADLNGWIRPEGEYTETLGSIMPVLQLYPAKSIGLHVRGGGGYAWSSVTDEFYDATSTYGGFGTLLGAGWEIPVSRSVFLTPYVDWYQYWIQASSIPDFTERVVAVGLSVGFQTR